MPSCSEHQLGWRFISTVVVRHTGYPVEDLDSLADEGLAATAAEVLSAWRDASSAAAVLKNTLKKQKFGNSHSIGAAVGMLKLLPSTKTQGLHTLLGAALPCYLDAVAKLDRLLAELQCAHRAALAYSQRHLVNLFCEPWRRQVLLLSNDAMFAHLQDRLTRAREDGARAKNLTDLLTMYLQRITTKNETNSHFGPISIGRVDDEATGVNWSMRDAPERFAFLTHWAASAMFAARLQGAGGERLRPRLHPMTFPSVHGVARYEYVVAPDVPYPWWLLGPHRPALGRETSWLLEQVDGERSVAELRELWTAHHDPAGFDDALTTLVAECLVLSGTELPAGNADTVISLRAELVDHGQDPGPCDYVEKVLREFEIATPADRIDLLDGLKKCFQQTCCAAPTRKAGQQQADRSVLFEDCLSRLEGFCIGRELKQFIIDELADVYDSVLLGPRLRINREREILAAWLTESFGAGRQVPLGEVYEQFVADRARLAELCDPVDEEVAAVEQSFADALLRGWDGHSTELEVPRNAIRELLAAQPPEPALCNPDIMLGAAHRDGFRTGEFFGVVGDCHAVRDLFTHGVLSPVLGMRAPGVVQDVLAGYRRIIDDDEVLVDVVRAHDSKNYARLELPIPDLEVAARSSKRSGEVLLPRDLSLVVRDGRAELRTHRLAGRLRLIESISTAASIRNDPLAVFSFPRSYGGGILDAMEMPYLPRIRTGRVVLTRRRWRVPVDELDKWSLPRRFASTDARSYVSAALLRERFDMPRHVFAKFMHEPKPVYVDWSAPMLVRQFFRLARGADAGDAVEISEMLPGPGQLWLRIDDKHYTSELRCTLFSR